MRVTNTMERKKETSSRTADTVQWQRPASPQQSGGCARTVESCSRKPRIQSTRKYSSQHRRLFSPPEVIELQRKSSFTIDYSSSFRTQLENPLGATTVQAGYWYSPRLLSSFLLVVVRFGCTSGFSVQPSSACVVSVLLDRVAGQTERKSQLWRSIVRAEEVLTSRVGKLPVAAASSQHC